MKEITTIVCLPYEVAVSDLVVQGSIKGECSRCKRAILISPASQRFIATHVTGLLCCKCGGELRPIEHLTPEQKVEVEAVCGPGYGKRCNRLVDRLNKPAKKKRRGGLG